MFLEVVRRIFPALERLFRFLRSDSRQEFLIGHLRSQALSLSTYLKREWDFEDMIFAWVDDGQIASLRKRDGDFQYHIRIFEDGEVRGHYEYAPEIAPLKHLRRVGREARKSDLVHFVGEHVQATPFSAQNYAIFPTVMQAHRTPSYRA